MGWRFPWASSLGSDFNRDFGAFTEEERRNGTGFNFGAARRAEIDLRHEELHGLSAFALEDGVVYHTYSCYDRGTDVLNATWQLLDRRRRDAVTDSRAGRAATTSTRTSNRSQSTRGASHVREHQGGKRLRCGRRAEGAEFYGETLGVRLSVIDEEHGL